jgi:dTDP-4-amino-4,6-dideoxygalactose transaminase
MTKPGFIAFHRPSIGREEIDEVTAALLSGWITTGPRTAQFEAEFRDYVGAPHALAVNSCTAGLHIALAALGVGPGDEVITSPMTFCSTVHTISHVGATPVLADIGADGNLDVADVEAKISPRTKAILPVHLAGLPCDMERIWRLARQHNLYVIEDAAHAVGTRYRGFPIGAGLPEQGLRSDAVSFSFYATKNLTTGEGGMVTTHDEQLLERMRRLCLHGISKDAWNRYSDKGNWYYEVVEAGFKYNLSDIQSAIGIHQLRKQESFIGRRRWIADRFNQAFSGCAQLELPPDSSDARHCWHLYVLRLRLDRLLVTREEFIRQLRELGIGCSVHFIPIPLHPAFRELSENPRNACPRALELYPRIVSLPLYPDLTDSEVERLIDSVLEVARGSFSRKLVPVGSQSE